MANTSTNTDNNMSASTDTSTSASTANTTNTTRTTNNKRPRVESEWDGYVRGIIEEMEYEAAERRAKALANMFATTSANKRADKLHDMFMHMKGVTLAGVTTNWDEWETMSDTLNGGWKTMPQRTKLSLSVELEIGTLSPSDFMDKLRGEVERAWMVARAKGEPEPLRLPPVMGG